MKDNVRSHFEDFVNNRKPEQAALLAADARLRPAPYWGKRGWVAIELGDIAAAELPSLLAHVHSLIGPAPLSPAS